MCIRDSLKVDRWGESYAWLVTNIDWNEVSSRECGRTVVNVQSCRSRQRDCHPLPNIPEINPEAWTRTELVGRVPGVLFPQNFLEESGLKRPMDRWFDNDRQSQDYYDNLYSNA